MKPAFVALGLMFWAAFPSPAHRLDEYLQGAILSVKADSVEVQLTLTPGVSVAPYLVSLMDTDRDGRLSESEKSAYAARVLRDLKLMADGRPVELHLRSTQFPPVAEMLDGAGSMEMNFNAEIPVARTLRFENHHQSQISAYQVNSLVPQDPAIRIVSQKRNESQSTYRLELGNQPDQSGSWTAFAVLIPIGWVAVAMRKRK